MTAQEFKEKGNDALKQGDYDAAIGFYTKAIKLDAHNYVYYSNRAAAYLHQKAYAEALSDAEKVIELNNTFVKGYLHQGSALESLGRLELALEAYQKAHQLDPANASIKDRIDSLAKKIADKLSHVSYYEILGVSKTATPAEIKKKYYILAKKYHPDRNGADPVAQEHFKKISEAYTILSDPQMKDQYDRFGPSAVGGNGQPGFNLDLKQLVRSIFGGDKFGLTLGEAFFFDDWIDELPIFTDTTNLALGASHEVQSEMKTQKPDMEECEEAEVAMLALALYNKLKLYSAGEHEMFKHVVDNELESLRDAPGGVELIAMAGYVYVQEAKQHAGRFLGLEGFFSKIAMVFHNISLVTSLISTGFSVLTTGVRFVMAIEEEEEKQQKRITSGQTSTPASDAKVEEEMLKMVQELMTKSLSAAWKAGKVMMERRLRKAISKALHMNQPSEKEIQLRAEGLLQLGHAWEAFSIKLAKEDQQLDESTKESKDYVYQGILLPKFREEK